MRKRNRILQAKFQEVESILNEMLLVGPETESHDSLSNDIKQKLVFIRNLLSAEAASNSKPHHLHHISQRLASLEKSFHEWDDVRTDGLNHERAVVEFNEGEEEKTTDGHGIHRTVADAAGADKQVVEFDGGRTEQRQKGKNAALELACCCGIFVGMVLVLIGFFSGCFHYVEESSFPVPT